MTVQNHCSNTRPKFVWEGHDEDRNFFIGWFFIYETYLSLVPIGDPWFSPVVVLWFPSQVVDVSLIKKVVGHPRTFTKKGISSKVYSCVGSTIGTNVGTFWGLSSGSSQLGPEGRVSLAFYYLYLTKFVDLNTIKQCIVIIWLCKEQKICTR